MLYLARGGDTERYRGAIIHIEASQFAPEEANIAAYRNGRISGPQFRDAYLRQLWSLWQRDRIMFVDLIDLISTADITLVDRWGDEPWAPRRVLAAVLGQLAQQRKSLGRPAQKTA
ncbi:MAG TPA: hypothetical protein VGW38_12905 [Chloroflexota bacterium]|nr:hypothetical protein [Chloroflexota bacterium]